MKTLTIICMFLLIGTLSCSFFNPDPYGCNSRGPIVVSDDTLRNGTVDQYYFEGIFKTANFAHSSVLDDSLLPPGLTAFDSLRTLYVNGVPTETGQYRFRVGVSENGTQCIGRSATFTVTITIQ